MPDKIERLILETAGPGITSVYTRENYRMTGEAVIRSVWILALIALVRLYVKIKIGYSVVCDKSRCRTMTVEVGEAQKEVEKLVIE